MSLPSDSRRAGRGRRRQPHPVRALRRPVRHRLQPGDADRRARRPRRAVRARGPGDVGEFVAGAVLKHSRDFNLARETVLGSGPRPAHPRVRHPAGLRHRAPGRHRRRQQDRARAARLGASRAARTPRATRPSASTTRCAGSCWPPAAPRRSGAGCRAAGRGPPPPPRPRHPAQRRTPHRSFDGRARRGHRPRRGASPRAAQDELAATSHQRLAAAYERGFLDDLVVPFRGLDRDQNLRPGSTVEKLATLKPVFGTGAPDATMTAGNSTPLTDGAAVALLGERGVGRGARARAAGLPVAVRDAPPWTSSTAMSPGRDGLLMAPAYAVPRMLERAGLGLGGLRPLRDPRGLRLPGARHARRLGEAGARRRGPGPLNVAGSSLATGHPFAATGARIVATLAKLLAERERPGRGLISICAAGGQGVTAILERD